MSQAKLTQEQINILNAAKGLDDAVRKPIKKNLFAMIKAALNIPTGIRVKAVIDNTQSGEYGYLHTKDGKRLNVGADGKFDGTFSDKPVTVKYGYVKLDGKAGDILKKAAIDGGASFSQTVDFVPGILGTARADVKANNTPVLTGSDGNTYVLVSNKDFN